MGLWLAIAVMTGAAIFVVLAALARRRPASDEPQGDVAVYRDQLDEIARDRTRGLIGEREAEGARTEVARRLIAASSSQPDAVVGDASASDRRRRIAAAAALVVVPFVSLGGYAALGRPEAPDRPLASRRGETPERQAVADLVFRVEAELASNPEDGRGWSVLGPVYMRLGRPADAAAAFANTIRLLGWTADREADRGEALFAAAEGVVTAEARAAFQRAATAEPPSVKGVLYLARAAQQDNDPAAALALLKPLFVAAPADAPYLEPVMSELQRLAAAPALPAPATQPSDVQKTPEQRLAQVREMVDRLNRRLDGEGGDVGEWLRLVKARAVLGDAEKAKAALAAAREKFAGDGRAAARLEALALGLGLEGRGA